MFDGAGATPWSAFYVVLGILDDVVRMGA